MGESSITSVSLEELLKSGALSTNTFLLKNEVSTSSVPHVNTADSNPSQTQMLNAAKVSLLLARAFEKYQAGAHASLDVSSLQLADFSIHLSYTLPQPPPPPDGVNAPSEDLESLISDISSRQIGDTSHRGYSLQPPPGGGNALTDDNLEPLSLYSFEGQEDTSLQFISEFFDFDKPLPQLTGQHQQPPQQYTATTQVTSANATDALVKPASRLSYHDVLSSEGFDRVWTLISIECIPSSGRYVSNTSPEQTLGDLIHCIYSGSNLRLSSALIQHPAEIVGNSSGGRAGKMKSNTRETLFSTLVGDGGFPTSICRLLSDLMCGNHAGREDRLHDACPYCVCPISVQDTIQDLEHMCVYPQIYLYDPGTEFYSTNLLFGQRLYGRKNELAQMLGISTSLETGFTSRGAECVFVSGGAGCGKSHFVNNVASFLTNIGWIVSNNIVSEGKSATDALLGALDSTTLLSLSSYLPSLRSVSRNMDGSTLPNNRPEMSQLQLTFLLSRLLGAVLSLNRRVMLFLDNYEHVDSSALDLLSEMLTSVGQLPIGRNNFLFIACHRDGINEDHPLTAHLSEIRRQEDISLTEINLNKLSIDDVTDIIMTELRLPRRLVLELANIVHKKTSGHALFVVQLLNSLVRDSVLAFSPMKRRYDWDPAKVRSLKTADNVASLVVSNLSSLNDGELHNVRVLSCFGMQAKLSVLALLKDAWPFGGVEPYLQGLIEGGVVETKDSLVVFTHDLIQQGVYNNIPTEDRRRLHLNIGISLGMKVALDQHSLMGQIEEIDFERLSFVERNVETLEINNIIGIATNQVNLVDPKSIQRSHRIRFARWNMVAASQFAKTFNLSASAHYCKKGISLLYDSLWCSETFDLCRALHESAASASLFLCDDPEAQKYANALIEKLPFVDSLAAQYIVLRTWERMGKYEEQVARGLAVLRGLKLDIPAEPSPSCIMKAMALTSNVASTYSIQQITNLRRGGLDSTKKNILLSLNSIIAGAFRSSSPFLPLITCAVVNYSLQNGVYEESALSFACLGYFKIGLVGDYEEARYWANATSLLLSKSATNIAASRVRTILYTYVQWFFVSTQKTLFSLLTINKIASAMGDVDSAIYSMFFSLRFSFYAGENLSMLLASFCELLRTMKRHKEVAKTALIHVAMIESLTGTKSNAFDVFEGTIPSEDFILADAKAKQNLVNIEFINLGRFFASFLFGDYQTANKLYDTVSSLPSHKQPTIWSIFSQYYRGIIAFHLYRDGEGEEWLEEGEKILQKFEHLAMKTTTNFFDSKLLLLRAEYLASSCEVRKAKLAFDASIQSARDHGFINDQGVAYECFGKYLASIVDNKAASNCFKSAHVCYMQWGALALANHVWDKYKLNTFDAVGNVSQFTASNTNKHERNWE